MNHVAAQLDAPGRIVRPAPASFASFCADHAAKLWGLIRRGNLPMPESEAILINTLTKAWQQFDEPARMEHHFFTRLVRLARQEGLPAGPLREALLAPTKRAVSDPGETR